MPKIPIGQRRLILHVAGALQPKVTSVQTLVGVPSTEGTASVATATNETSLKDTSGKHRSATGETTGANLPVVPANSPTPVAGVHFSATNNTANSDLYQHVNGLLQEQQRLLTSNLPTNSHVQPSQVSWNDPQVHLSSAAGKSTSNYLEICDFVQTCFEEEVVLWGQGDQQIVMKSSPKKPRLENITLCQWSVANLAILYQLVGENKLQARYSINGLP